MDDIIIETHNLTKSFGKLVAVSNLNIKIPRGVVYGFLGPNGAGKTTSLKMIVGLLNPTKGSVNFKLMKPNENAYKNRIGLIPQEIVIWENLTVEENLWYMASIYKVPTNKAKERINALIKEIHLEEKRGTLAKNLSGGLARRLNIIMGLVHDPEIIVCDEPTPGLDAQSRTLVWKFIKELSTKKGKTVILTTHFMEEADRLSDIVAIIDHGKLLVVDSPLELKNSIGEGDLVEINLNDNKLLNEAVDKLRNYSQVDDVVLLDNYIQLRCLNAPSKLANIFNKIEVIDGLVVEDVKLRHTTLEDVFIHLTGRELRE